MRVLRRTSACALLHTRISAASAQQAGMVALLHDLALLHHDDAVGVFDGR